jgi:hypothetical protein
VDVACRRINLGQISTSKELAQEGHEVTLSVNGVGLGANLMDDAVLQKDGYGKIARFRIIEMRCDPK